MKFGKRFTYRKQPVQIGVIFPQTEMDQTPDDISRYATGVEEMGYKHLLAFDHVVGGSIDAYPELQGRYTSSSLFHEVFVLFGYLAAITNSLELASGVIILPQRQTTLVAKQAAAIDVLSEGRLRLGIGIGWNKIEYQALNENFSNRARRFEEQIELMRRLWERQVIDFEGEFHTVKQAGIHPLPPRKAIPMWIGASAEPAVRRAARMVDGFTSTTPVGPQLEILIGWLQDELARNDRSWDDFGFECRITLANSGEDDWKREFSYWQEVGASHVLINSRDGGLVTVDEHLDALERALRVLEPLR